MGNELTFETWAIVSLDRTCSRGKPRHRSRRRGSGHSPPGTRRRQQQARALLPLFIM